MRISRLFWLMVTPCAALACSDSHPEKPTDAGVNPNAAATLDFCNILTRALASEAFGAPANEASTRLPSDIAECKYLRDAPTSPESSFEVRGLYREARDAEEGKQTFLRAYKDGGFTAVAGVGELAFARSTSVGTTPVSFIASYQGKYHVEINANGPPAALEGVAKKVMAALPK